MGNPVVHFEVNGPDPDLLGKFYSELFGWHTQSMPEMRYVFADTSAGTGINGGFGTDDGDPYVTVYVEVADPQGVLGRAGALGGRTVMPVTEIPGVVTLARFADPQGNVIGLVKEEPDGPGGASAGTNPSVSWFEILGPDGSALRTFYAALFGWTFRGSTEGDVDYGEVQGAGIGGGVGIGPEGVPHVTVYAQVPDIPAYLDRATSLGGRTALEPMQVGEGLTIAALNDPQGTVFGLYTLSG